MQTLDSDYSLQLFQSSHSLHSNPSLDKGIQLINNMVELNYLKYGLEGLELTNSGIEYMMKKFQEFNHNIDTSSVDMRTAHALSGTDPNNKKRVGVNISKEFKTMNLLISNNDTEPDYNLITFKKKCQDTLEPGVDGIEKIH